MAFSGPTANLPGRARRRGRSGQAYTPSGVFLGEVTGVDWTTEIAQIDVEIAGSWRNEQIPGAETRTGTFRHQDVDDRFKLLVWTYVDARRRGDRSALPPEFDLIVAIDDTHSPAATRWILKGCQLYQYSGGYSMDDDLITREIPFSYRDDAPLDSFIYGGQGTDFPGNAQVFNSTSSVPSGDQLLPR